MQERTRAEKRYAVLNFEVMSQCCSQWLTEGLEMPGGARFGDRVLPPVPGAVIPSLINSSRLELEASVGWELEELNSGTVGYRGRIAGAILVRIGSRTVLETKLRRFEHVSCSLQSCRGQTPERHSHLYQKLNRLFQIIRWLVFFWPVGVRVPSERIDCWSIKPNQLALRLCAKTGCEQVQRPLPECLEIESGCYLSAAGL